MVMDFGLCSSQCLDPRQISFGTTKFILLKKWIRFFKGMKHCISVIYIINNFLQINAEIGHLFGNLRKYCCSNTAKWVNSTSLPHVNLPLFCMLISNSVRTWTPVSSCFQGSSVPMARSVFYKAPKNPSSSSLLETPM